MKGGFWRFIFAIAILFLAIYFYVYKSGEDANVTEDDSRLWPNKMSAMIDMENSLHAIVDAEINEMIISGSYIECAPNPVDIPDMEVSWDLKAADGWSDLGVRLRRQTWFQYEVVVFGEDSFNAYARTYAEGVLTEYTIDKDHNIWQSE